MKAQEGTIWANQGYVGNLLNEAKLAPAFLSACTPDAQLRRFLIRKAGLIISSTQVNHIYLFPNTSRKW